MSRCSAVSSSAAWAGPTEANLTALSLPSAVVDRVTSAVTESAGTAIAGLQAQPSTAAIAEAAGDAMIHASRLTTGFAAIALVVGLLATFRLPRTASCPVSTDPAPGDRRPIEAWERPGPPG